MAKNPWAYKVDYVEGIAEAERAIAAYDLMIKYGWYDKVWPEAEGREWPPAGSQMQLKFVDLVLNALPANLPGMDLTVQERGDLAYRASSAYVDYPAPEGYEETSGAYKRGSEVWDKVEAVWACYLPVDEAEAKKERRRYVSQRSRYRRKLKG